jgi:hypothetical protein
MDMFSVSILENSSRLSYITYYFIPNFIPKLNIVTRRRVNVMIITGSSSDDWIYWHFGYNLS